MSRERIAREALAKFEHRVRECVTLYAYPDAYIETAAEEAILALTDAPTEEHPSHDWDTLHRLEEESITDCARCGVSIESTEATYPCPKVEPQEAWRPIETAPRDSSRVLVAGKNSMGEWRVCEAWWRLPYENAPADQCWWCYDKDGTLLDASIYEGKGATHWMPLPEPPQPKTPE